MCLILFAHGLRADLPLVVAANRDEFHGRPTAAAAWWQDRPQLLAGRDLQDGGTWLGISRTGRFAAVTNFSEEPPAPSAAARSRGELTTGFLQGEQTPGEYLAEIARRADQYRGFNLLVGDGTQLHYLCNRNGSPRALPPGVYGLSNSVLDSAWPKVVTGKQDLAAAVANLHGAELTRALFALLGNRDVAPDDQLPGIERGLELARRVAPRFIASDTYGTRACTVLVAQRTAGAALQVTFAEHSFGPNARDDGRVDHELAWELARTDATVPARIPAAY